MVSAQHQLAILTTSLRAYTCTQVLLMANAKSQRPGSGLVAFETSPLRVKVVHISYDCGNLFIGQLDLSRTHHSSHIFWQIIRYIYLFVNAELMGRQDCD